MVRRSPILATLSALIALGSSALALNYEQAKIDAVHIVLPKRAQDAYKPDALASELKTRPGHAFSQEQFDEDLKHLSTQFDRVDPKITEKDGSLVIDIHLTPKPEIGEITFNGNRAISSKKLRRELGLKVGDLYDRAQLARGIAKLKEYYVTKSYFETHVSYDVKRDDNDQIVDIRVTIEEGKSGRIARVLFEGVNKEDAKALEEVVYTKKYNGLTSWYTKAGTYQQEMIEHDKMSVVSYMQNKGHADVHVDVDIKDAKVGRIDVIFTVKLGPIYKVGSIEFTGNRVFTDADVESHLALHEGETYAPDKIQATVRAIKELYGKKGYIDAAVSYHTQLKNASEDTYNVYFDIHELEQYYIGTIKVIGNYKTNPNVILNESLLVPGEVFDSRKLSATEERLRATGFFKEVNIYPLKPSAVATSSSHYRDVYIEVEEAPTGHFSLFGGASSGADTVFGGVELIEKNFNIAGLATMWSKGLSELRGNGEYLHLRANIGAKVMSYTFSWMTPYAGDTLWRVGFDVHKTYDKSQSSNYKYKSAGDKIYATYPLSSFWTFSCNYRILKSINEFNSGAVLNTRRQLGPGGLLSGVGVGLNFDSTDSPRRPRKGFRSNLAADFVGLGGDFTYWKFLYINTQYIDLKKFGIFKFRGDLKFIYPNKSTPVRGNGDDRPIPLSERFFLGGETTLRGFHYDSLGPTVDGNPANPLGGISYGLGSLEYIYPVLEPVQLFAFYDAGTDTEDKFKLGKIYMSVGGGMRMDILGQLPLTFGYGYVLNKDIPKAQKKGWFFSFGMQY